MKNIFAFILFISPLFYFSQLENSQWRFASNCGLSFTSSPASLVASSVNSGGGSCSSIADASGNLLFYTDGFNVWNRNNSYMAGTNTPLVGAGTTQGVLIAKQPGNNSNYYIFVAGNYGVLYSIVDMSMAAGAGSVTVKNMTLTTVGQTYKIAGTRNCSKTGIWIVTQENGLNSWRSYLLTSSGISAPVISSTGHAHITYAAMKFSPDGSKIATTEWGDGIYLYDFNVSTGAVSGMTVLDGMGFAAWGVEFSPDGSKLYASRSYATILQWDLNAGSPSAIAASIYTVYVTPTSFNGNQGALQVAPDGKIYQSYGSAHILSVIQNPNAAGSACAYAFGAVNLLQQYTGYGLPNQVKTAMPLPSFTSAISQSSCLTLQFSPVSTSIGGIGSGTPQAVTWLFGDPSSGAANSSSVLNPNHVFSAAGSYTVKMVVANACGASDTIQQTVNVPNNVSTLAFSGSTLICMGQSTGLSVSGAGSYTWNSSMGQYTGSTIVVNPPSSMVFTVSAGTGNSCITTSLFALSVLPPSTFAVAGATDLCVGESLSLTANGVSNYTWTSSAGSLGTLSTLTLNPAQGVNNYTVYGYNPSLSCIGQLVVTVSVSPYPVIGISGPTMVCVGEAPIYTAVGASNFTWTSGSGNLYGTSITPTLTSAQNYTVSAGNSGSHCVSKQVLSIGTSICSGLNAYHTEGIRIYPNPFYGKLQLSSVKAFTLKVFELSGRLIYRDDASATEREMDLSAFSAGVYLVEMSSDEGVTYCKVLKLVNP